MNVGDNLDIAGVRLVDGRQIFVEGAPEDLDQGLRVAIRWVDQDLQGTVSIAPRLIVFRDPEARLGTFLRIIPSAPIGLSGAAEPPLAHFQANEAGPDPGCLNDMLNLARVETVRLDD